MRAWLLVGLFPVVVAAEPATERYAPAQLEMAHTSLEHAREAAHAGDGPLAGELAWQASVDARLAWAMSESPELRGAAFEIVSEAQQIVREALARGSAPR